MKDKNIVITGSTDGIGYALASQLIKQKTNLICINRSSEKVDKFHEEIDASNVKFLDLVTDLALLDEAKCIEMVNEIVKDFNEIHGIVLNASILGSMKPIKDVDEGEWRKVFEVNIHANFLLIKHLMPLLSSKSKAKIILLSSGVADIGRAYWGAYSASKFALKGLAEILADECSTERNIQIVSFNPGATNTKMRTQAYPSEDPSSIASPDETASYLVQILSEDFEAPKIHLSKSDLKI
jgi:NAD(P)-dependent dehydrogenase (short-subunit alcohol dehydrogenase family)